MTPSVLFLVGLAATLVTSLAIVAYLRVPLHSILWNFAEPGSEPHSGWRFQT